jgi:ABC-type multidrug transport system fused ATPase/permease subunit
MTVFLGELMEGLFKTDLQAAGEAVFSTALIFLYLGIGIFVCAYPEIAFFGVSSQRQASRIRQEYLKAILRQDMAWFDMCKSNQLATRLAGDVPQVLQRMYASAY